MPTPASDAPIEPLIARRPFVGRRAELEVLRTHLGRGRLIVVTGDPGIGKTRLAEEFAAEAEARGARSCIGAAAGRATAPRRSGRGSRSLATMHVRDDDAARYRSIERAARATLEGRARRDGDTPPQLEPAPARFRLFDTITTLLVDVATARPLVLVLEDLHWADMPSLVLLQFLVRHARKAPVLTSSRRTATSRSARRIR